MKRQTSVEEVECVTLTERERGREKGEGRRGGEGRRKKRKREKGDGGYGL